MNMVVPYGWSSKSPWSRRMDQAVCQDRDCRKITIHLCLSCFHFQATFVPFKPLNQNVLVCFWRGYNLHYYGTIYMKRELRSIGPTIAGDRRAPPKTRLWASSVDHQFAVSPPSESTSQTAATRARPRGLSTSKYNYCTVGRRTV